MAASERCDFSDLPKDMCGYCKPELLPQTRIPQAARNRMGPERPRYGSWFPASFPGECDGCGGHIDEGDQIRSDGEGGWLCEECGEQ
jgi:hypothetical protein